MKCTVLLDCQDESRLLRAVQQTPLATRHRVARAALRVGLDAVLQRPDLLLTYGVRRPSDNEPNEATNP